MGPFEWPMVMFIREVLNLTKEVAQVFASSNRVRFTRENGTRINLMELVFSSQERMKLLSVGSTAERSSMVEGLK